MDDMYAVGWRIWAWIKLVQVWASLRWSDVQAILPGELRLIEGRLTANYDTATDEDLRSEPAG